MEFLPSMPRRAPPQFLLIGGTCRSLQAAAVYLGSRCAIKYTDIPQIPGPLGLIFILIEARRNETSDRDRPRWQPNPRVGRLAALELVDLTSSRRTSSVAASVNGA
jgi:hypothetical protein